LIAGNRNLLLGSEQAFFIVLKWGRSCPKVGKKFVHLWGFYLVRLQESLRGSFLTVMSDCVALFGTLVLLADLGATTTQASAGVPGLSYPAWVTRLHEFAIKTIPSVVFVFMICFGLYRLLSCGLILGALLVAPYGAAWAGGRAIFRLSFGAGLRLHMKPGRALTTAVLTLGLVYVAGGIQLARLWRDELWNLPVYAVLAFLTLIYSIAALSSSQDVHHDGREQALGSS
jgi:hypothetical protein